jgi:NTE family protein
MRLYGAPSAGIDGLRRRAKVALVVPDEVTMEVLGPNPMDSARWEPVIEAGVAQGRRLTSEVAAVGHS